MPQVHLENTPNTSHSSCEVEFGDEVYTTEPLVWHRDCQCDSLMYDVAISFKSGIVTVEVYSKAILNFSVNKYFMYSSSVNPSLFQKLIWEYKKQSEVKGRLSADLQIPEIQCMSYSRHFAQHSKLTHPPIKIRIKGNETVFNLRLQSTVMSINSNLVYHFSSLEIHCSVAEFSDHRDTLNSIPVHCQNKCDQNNNDNDDKGGNGRGGDNDSSDEEGGGYSGDGNGGGGGSNNSNEGGGDYSGDGNGRGGGSDSSDEGCGGYSGDGENSDNEESKSGDDKNFRYKKRKKGRKGLRSVTRKEKGTSAELQTSGFCYGNDPVSLVRGLDDKVSHTQQESNDVPPSTMTLVGETIHVRRSRAMQPCHELIYRVSPNHHCTLQLLLQQCAHRPQQEGTQFQVVNENSSLVPILSRDCAEESSPQHISAIVHGGVLIQPQTQHDSPSFSSAAFAGILTIFPLTHPDVPPSSTTDSGLGPSPLTAEGQQSHLLPPENNDHPAGNVPATSTRQREVQNSSPSEREWDPAEPNVELQAVNDMVSQLV